MSRICIPDYEYKERIAKAAKKSGRISAAAAFAGELLGLKPIIEFADGITTTIDKKHIEIRFL